MARQGIPHLLLCDHTVAIGIRGVEELIRNGRRPIRRQLLGANGDLSDDGMPLTSSAYLFPVSALHVLTSLPRLRHHS